MRRMSSRLRSLAIVELLARHPEGLPARAIAERLGIPLPATERLLHELARTEYVKLGPDGQSHRLRLKLAALGLGYLGASGVTDLVQPILQLPAESPVASALDASAGRGVVLVRADGVAAGLLDRATAEKLAGRSPHSPAELAAEPIRPETVLLDSEPGEEIIERVHETAAWQFLVVDAEGRPSGVLRREDLKAALRHA